MLIKTEMPLSKTIRLFVRQTENILDTEISLLRNPGADPNGMLVDVYTYDIEKNIILFPANYIGLLKDFIIARHGVHLLIKGAAAKTPDIWSVLLPEIPYIGGYIRSISMHSSMR